MSARQIAEDDANVDCLTSRRKDDSGWIGYTVKEQICSLRDHERARLWRGSNPLQAPGWFSAGALLSGIAPNL
jgi:hypothetical protein